MPRPRIPDPMTLICTRCDKPLTKKRARLIDGKVLCSACVFPVYCKVCSKPVGAKGYFGASCQCNTRKGVAGSNHGAGIGSGGIGGPDDG